MVYFHFGILSEVIRSVLLTEKYIMCDVLEDADLTLSKLVVVTVLYRSHFISSLTVWNPLFRGGKCALRVTALHHSGTNAVTSESARFI